MIADSGLLRKEWMGPTLRWLRVCTRIGIGAVFVYAAIPKILHPQDFALMVFHYRMLPGAAVNLLVIILPWLELFCGVAFAFSRSLRQAATLMLGGLLVVFMVAILINVARGNNVECGCFSVGGSGHESSWWTIARDLVLLLLTAWAGYEARCCAVFEQTGALDAQGSGFANN
jgi:uncharacterized membrane protein YphA (DoxX/SURF4 family)